MGFDKNDDGRGAQLRLLANPVDELQDLVVAVRMPVDDDDVGARERLRRVESPLQINFAFAKAAHGFTVAGEMFVRQRTAEENAFRFHLIDVKHLPFIKHNSSLSNRPGLLTLPADLARFAGPGPLRTRPQPTPPKRSGKFLLQAVTLADRRDEAMGCYPTANSLLQFLDRQRSHTGRLA